MKIELVKPAVIDCITHPTGTVVECVDGLARRLIAQGKAKEYTPPRKKTREVKESPDNRMITDEVTR